jgi:hypothetical protein
VISERCSAKRNRDPGQRKTRGSVGGCGKIPIEGPHPRCAQPHPERRRHQEGRRQTQDLDEPAVCERPTVTAAPLRSSMRPAASRWRGAMWIVRPTLAPQSSRCRRCRSSKPVPPRILAWATRRSCWPAPPIMVTRRWSPQSKRGLAYGSADDSIPQLRQTKRCRDWDEFLNATPETGEPAHGAHGRENLRASVKSILLERFIWADSLAEYYAHKYPSAYITAYLLSATAVFVALGGVSHSSALAVFELAVLIGTGRWRKIFDTVGSGVCERVRPHSRDK